MSKSGNTSRFFPDMRFGTDCGRAVHALRAVEESCACHELCAAHISMAVRRHRRAAEQTVPQTERRERRVATSPMKGEKAQQVSLPRARHDCPLLAEHAATASCISSPYQLHNSLTTHASCWLCPSCSQEEACQQISTQISLELVPAGRSLDAGSRDNRVVIL